MTKKSLLCAFIIVFLSNFSHIVGAKEKMLVGRAVYHEPITLPANAVFTATLEDISLMDVPAVILGNTQIDPAVNIPIAFAIHYNSSDIKLGRHYNVRGKITVDGELKYTTDTIQPVLTGKDEGEPILQMISVPAPLIKLNTP